MVLSVQHLSSQTYGNWSGILYTGSSSADVHVPIYDKYTAGLRNFLTTAYKGKYIRVVPYVVKKGQRYTVSIKYPNDGDYRAMEFTGFNPLQTTGFSISYQNPNRPGKYSVNRVNFTNSANSNYDRVMVIVSSDKPSKPFYLRIEYPAVPDNVVDAAWPNPTEPGSPKTYWGTIVKYPLIIK